MHDGKQTTLKEVVDFYVGGGTSNPYLDKEIKELKLSGQGCGPMRFMASR